MQAGYVKNYQGSSRLMHRIHSKLTMNVPEELFCLLGKLFTGIFLTKENE